MVTENDRNDLVKKGIELAKHGDHQMLKLFLERLIPREQPVELELPPIKDHHDVAKANERIIRAASAGEILPSAAAALTAMIANINRTLSDAEFEDAITREQDEIGDVAKRVKRYDQIRAKG